jgi:LacI family transcriptional regulator/LacI family repressor for deo operon, udp, cdd, tsx, nupC, and nupG
LAAAKIPANDAWVRIGQVRRTHADDAAEGQALAPELLRAGVTAVFCYNDLVAVGVLVGCRELGIAVPEQLSVVGYDDVELARYVTPPLTTIHQPKLRMGMIAMQMLLDILDGQPVQDQFLPVDLVVRASTGPAPAGTLAAEFPS